MKARRDESKAQLWMQRIAAFERSNLSRRAWCRQEGLNPNTLDYWRSRLRPATKTLVPIVVAHGSTADVEVALPSGMRLRARNGTDTPWLAGLLRALAC